MAITYNISYFNKPALLALCMLLAVSGSLLAGSLRDNKSVHDTPASHDSQNYEETLPTSSEAENPESVTTQSLEGNISPEDRMRLRRDLDEYSRSVDPDHSQIEERRRAMRQRLQERFSQTDKDNDGSISRIEAFEGMPQIARHFTQVDANGDGVITLNELEAAQAKAIEHQRATAAKNDSQETDSPKHKSKDVISSRKRTL